MNCLNLSSKIWNDPGLRSGIGSYKLRYDLRRQGCKSYRHSEQTFVKLCAQKVSALAEKSAATLPNLSSLVLKKKSALGSDETEWNFGVILMDVQEMMCGSCAATVKKILNRHPNVVGSTVNLLTETAAVRVKLGKMETMLELEQELSALINDSGFPASVRKLKQSNSEVAEKRVAMATKREEAIKRTRSQVAVASVLALLSCGGHLGHIFHLFGFHAVAHGSLFAFLDDSVFKATISLIAFLGPARELVTDGLSALKRGSPNMNSLVGLGSMASFTISTVAIAKPDLGWETASFEEPVMLLAVVLLGRALEARARAQASSDLQALFSLLPATCHLLVAEDAEMEDNDASTTPPLLESFQTDSSLQNLVPFSSSRVEVSSWQVRPGDSVIVLPGETIPVDGEVTAGASSTDESALTGEALPVPKSPGSKVSAGSVNWDGPIVVQATATGANCTVSIITRMVEDAQSREAPIQRLADKLAGPFVYAIMALSLATFGFWYTLGCSTFPQVLLSDMAGEDSSPLLLSLRLAVDVMVVACPCALGLATPTAVLVGTAMGATRGLLIRGGDVLERLATVDTVALDKTGTLTQGRLSLTQISSFPSAGSPGMSPMEVLSLAASVEYATNHPVAKAIMAAAEEQSCKLLPVRGALTVPGKGVLATVGGRQVAVGELSWVEQQSTGPAVHPETVGDQITFPRDGSHSRGVEESVVYVGVKGQGLVGEIRAKDTLRTDALPALAWLKQAGIQVSVLSGDGQGPVTAVGDALGLLGTEISWRMTPQEKSQRVLSMQEAGRKVAMVGDGVNDAPALACAEVGVAISQSERAMDAASDAASVVLMRDELWQLVEAIDLARATLWRVKGNLVWAMAYNCLAIPLAGGALLPVYGIALTPSLSGGMMAVSSIVVVMNSVLLQWHQAPRKPAGESK